MFSFFKSLLSFDVEEEKASKKQTEKNIVSTLSRGNIHLQSGRYMTESDVEELRKKAFN